MIRYIMMRELYLNIYRKKFTDEHIIKFLIETITEYSGMIFMLDCKKIYYVNNKFDYEIVQPIPLVLMKYSKFFSKIVINVIKQEYVFIPHERYMEAITVKFV